MKKTNLLPGSLVLLTLLSCNKQIEKTSFQEKLKSSSFHSSLVSTGDVVGKITVGYQGWFSAKGDGSPINSFSHTNLEMWPDMREYKSAYEAVPFSQDGSTQPPFSGTLTNGQPATMFSSYDAGTVNLHFQWMRQYGIDCAALQRFANEISPGSLIKDQRDGMARKVETAAVANGIKFYIMYDASGWGDLNAIKSDWTNTIKGTLDLLNSSAYAKQNGKPVVSIYGLGYASHPSSAIEALDLINWFKNQGCYVIGSIPGGWLKGENTKPNFNETFAAFNMLSAWGVGGLIDNGYAAWIAGDQSFCREHGIDYQPCIYPGTAFHNTNGTISRKNEIPRQHGDLLWKQFATLKQASISTTYIAMFDELNEATSIFKVAEDSTMIPKGKYFLTLDADGVHVSSDFYLRLVHDGGDMLKGITPYRLKLTTPFTTSANSGVTFYQSSAYQGDVSAIIPPGKYNLQQMAALGVKNDWASSIRIPKGRVITMYSDDNFSGWSWTLNADTPDFSKLNPNANDLVSSCIIK
ncbi:lectin [Mucilaginibacter endophyticus]|uniref:lectin n=1 Tax=Mucilaginibacter endophyticus TaxID=2675003 RepID=UPI0012B16878|nr:lectin [Mucilaginibacter endophyticus]